LRTAFYAVRPTHPGYDERFGNENGMLVLRKAAMPKMLRGHGYGRRIRRSDSPSLADRVLRAGCGDAIG
jgi:hypothetical protein